MINSREWKIELRNMAAWEMSESVPGHRPTVHVIEYAAYEAVCKERDNERHIAIGFAKERDEARAESKDYKESWLNEQNNRIIAENDSRAKALEVNAAIEVLRFYADQNTWSYTTYHVCQTITPDDLSTVPSPTSFGKKTANGYVYECGGAMARKFLAEHGVASSPKDTK